MLKQIRSPRVSKSGFEKGRKGDEIFSCLPFFPFPISILPLLTRGLLLIEYIFSYTPLFSPIVLSQFDKKLSRSRNTLRL